MSAHPTKIHPLVAAAAGSVIVISLVGTAAIMDWLPGSHSDDKAPEVVAAVQPGSTARQAAVSAANAAGRSSAVIRTAWPARRRGRARA